MILLSQHASQSQGTTPSPFTITDGRRIFTTHYPLTYERTPEQPQEVETLLTKLKKIENLDLPLRLTIPTDSVEDKKSAMQLGSL